MASRLGCVPSWRWSNIMSNARPCHWGNSHPGQKAGILAIPALQTFQMIPTICVFVGSISVQEKSGVQCRILCSFSYLVFLVLDLRFNYLVNLGCRCFLETAAETAEVVDCEGTDQVNRCRSAESDAQALSYVHCGFTAVTLTEGDLHSSHRGWNCGQCCNYAGNVASGVISKVSQLTERSKPQASHRS